MRGSGRQSAALLIMPAIGEAWHTRFNVRVDDNEDPLGELRHLVRLSRAYELAELADERLAEGAHAEAARLYLEAAELAPEADGSYSSAAVQSIGMTCNAANRSA